MKKENTKPVIDTGIEKPCRSVAPREYIDRQLMIYRKKINHLAVAIFAGLLFIPQLASSALPTAVDPSSGPSGGNFVSWLTGWFGDSTESGALMISSAVFLWCAWIIASKFNEARNAKEPDWGSFGLTAVVAGVVMVACTYILTQAIAVIA